MHKNLIPDMTKNPISPSTNLFDYATKELSQDAVICWLIAWAGQNKSNDTEEEELRRCGREFVHALLNHKREEKSIELPEQIATEIHRQDKSIDVLARINGKQVLLIEDKKRTRDHSGQLKRYYDHVAGGHTKKLLGKTAPKNIYPIYFKTGNQPHADDRRIEGVISGGNGYKVFNREDFLRVLNGYKGNSRILMDYRQYLQDMEDDTNGYKEWRKGSPKSWQAWEGFYRCLECELGRGGWGYVPNPSGGFLGFWWDPSGDWTIYLQIENDEKLCFKVGAKGESKEEKTRLKWDWHRRIMQAGNRQKQRVGKPRVMRIGNTMTVGIWREDWLAFEHGKLDIPGTVKNLKQAELMLRAAKNSE